MVSFFWVTLKVVSLKVLSVYFLLGTPFKDAGVGSCICGGFRGLAIICLCPVAFHIWSVHLFIIIARDKGIPLYLVVDSVVLICIILWVNVPICGCIRQAFIVLGGQRCVVLVWVISWVDIPISCCIRQALIVVGGHYCAVLIWVVSWVNESISCCIRQSFFALGGHSCIVLIWVVSWVYVSVICCIIVAGGHHCSRCADTNNARCNDGSGPCIATILCITFCFFCFLLLLSLAGGSRF
mmetsp:Transcript_26241/g.72409  ORF Transcript_26241/g.72409 Transcript_26241/m.72409 type:complete len:239 (-) Transcript_26241:1998-2714(-)